MAERGGGGVRFVERKFLREPENLLRHSRDLGFLRAPEARDRLLDAQRRIFEDLAPEHGRGGDRRAAGSAEHLRDFEIIHVNRFFQRDVAHGKIFAAIRAELVNFAEAVRERKFPRKPERFRKMQNRLAARNEFDDGEAAPAQARIDAENEARVWLARARNHRRKKIPAGTRRGFRSRRRVFFDVSGKNFLRPKTAGTACHSAKKITPSRPNVKERFFRFAPREREKTGTKIYRFPEYIRLITEVAPHPYTRMHSFINQATPKSIYPCQAKLKSAIKTAP